MKSTLAAVAAGMLVLVGACSQPIADDPAGEFSPRSVEMVIPFNPGGGVDLAGRTIAQSLESVGAVEQAIQITNLPGGSGGVGINKMRGTYEGDGNKLMTIATHVITTPIQQNEALDVNQLTPLARMYTEFGLVVVKADSKFRSIEDVASAMRARPDEVVIGGGSAGSVDEVLAILLAKAVDVDRSQLTYVPYDGGESVAALLGGNLDVMVGGFDLLDLIDGGEMRALAVASPERISGTLAETPTLKQQGFDVEVSNWRGVFGPRDMPESAVTYWRDSLRQVNDSPEWQTFLADNSFVPDFETAEFASDIEEQDLQFREALGVSSS